METLHLLSLGKTMNKITQNIVCNKYKQFILVISGALEVFYEKYVLEAFQTSHDNTCAGISIFIKLQTYGLQVVIGDINGDCYL